MFISKLAANGSEEFANKLWTVVRKQVGWDPERDYPMVEEQVRNMRRFNLKHLCRSRKFLVSAGRNQNILILLRCPWQRTENFHCDKVEWTGGREQL